MSEFLSSIKADLLDRRILPLVALVAVGLLAAVGYVVLGGGSSSSAPSAPAVAAIPSQRPGIAVTQASSANAVAETTDGSAEQHHGTARDPFAPLPGAPTEASLKSAVAAGTSTSASPSAGSGSATGSSSPSSSTGSASPSSEPAHTAPSTPAKPSAPQPVYHVAVLFGLVPAEAPAEGVQLTPYENLKLYTPLPSAQQSLIAYRGVTAGGKSATFTLTGEVILHGAATCLPSASQCQAIDLQSGQTEQLEALTASGQAVTYELRIVSISASKASSASVKSLLREGSKAGRELLSRDGLMSLPGLRYSARAGVLVLAGHGAFGHS